MSSSLVAPRPADETPYSLYSLNEAVPESEAPGVSGAYFKPATSTVSLLEQVRLYLAKASGNDASAVEELASQGQQTYNSLEVKNQQRVKGFEVAHQTGGNRNFSLNPYLTRFNVQRLNEGEQIRPNLSAPVIRSMGNAFGATVSASNWADVAEATTQMANLDPSGFAQVNHTGQFLFTESEGTTWRAERANLQGGPLLSNSGQGGGVGASNPNAGAEFNRTDGAAGGDLAYASVAQPQTNAFATTFPSGRGALAVPDVYGIEVLFNPDV